jgi:hypothetical protein
VQQLGGAAFRGFAAAVVAGGGGDIGVTSEFLDGGDVRAPVEEVADKGAAEVVGGEVGDSGCFGAFEEKQVDGLGGHAGDEAAVRGPSGCWGEEEFAAFFGGDEESAGGVSPDGQPGGEGGSRATDDRDQALFVALTQDFESTFGGVVIGDLQDGSFSAAQATAI